MMITIEGNKTRAVCWTDQVDERAKEQISTICSLDSSEGSTIRIMPDVHAGKGCTIGTTMTIHDRVVPAFVGVDIGCGMYTVSLGKTDIDLKQFDEAAHAVPSGFNVWESPVEEFDLTQLRCFDKLSKLPWLSCSLGSLGGGNHFIEIDEGEDGTRYLVIHSGSRNLGKQVAGIYQALAADEARGIYDYEKERQEIITSLKKEGRANEIQAALAEISDRRNSWIELNDNLCSISGKHFEDYIHDMKICQEFAVRNREIIAEVLLEKCGLTAQEAFHTIHNYIATDEMMLRKGAIAAHKGQKVLIPLNMRDGSILAVGKGNPDWNCSAPHGAGRLMSRKQAKEQLKVDEFEKSMEGIYTTSISEGTLDEAPMAYKPKESILKFIGETVDVLEVIRPIYNFKAEEKMNF